jgi:hypothetical protein
MAKFNLSEEVSELEYNFEPYAGSGVIPEPSAAQVNAFRQGLGEFITAEMPSTKPAKDMDSDEFVSVLNTYLSRDTTEIDEKVLHMASDVCSNQPSFDDLTVLPFRARQAFLGWLVGILLVPEVPTPVTNN